MLSYPLFSKWNEHTNNEVYQKHGEYFLRFKDTDKRRNRIYFKLDVKNKENFHAPVPPDLSTFLYKAGYSITDYRKGLCKKSVGSNSNEIRIGKVLEDANQPDLLALYTKSKNNILKNTDNLQLVISRHPYDTIGISTGRGWTSCVDILSKTWEKVHLSKLIDYLKTGGLVAYLIRENDPNIEYPVARIKINRIPKSGKLMSCCENHGIYVEEFRKFVDLWIRDYNNSEFAIPDVETPNPAVATVAV